VSITSVSTPGFAIIVPVCLHLQHWLAVVAGLCGASWGADRFTLAGLCVTHSCVRKHMYEMLDWN
jgi:hypothetical protein